MLEHQSEVDSGDRFRFGENWKSFLSVLDDERIAQAENSLKNYLQVESLDNLTFVDVGSGSGLFSLAARRLGARVHSFDFDPESVKCARELKNRYFKDDCNWVIEHGSVLDTNYIQQIGTFDVVYSWGVLHHTGNMKKSLDNVALLVKENGRLFISIYNYQVYWSAFYTVLKRAYNKSSYLGKRAISGLFISFQIVKGGLKDLLFFRNPINRYSEKKKSRGMSVWYDWIDWIGGYPFEVSKPGDMVDVFYSKGFTLLKLKTCGGGHGCNEYVFIKGLDRGVL